MPRKAKNSKPKLHKVNADLSEEVFRLTNRLLKEEGLTKNDIFQRGIVEIAKDKLPEVKDWATFELVAKTFYAMHLVEEAKLEAKKEREEKERFKAEALGLRALVPDASPTNSEVLATYNSEFPEL